MVLSESLPLKLFTFFLAVFVFWCLDTFGLLQHVAWMKALFFSTVLPVDATLLVLLALHSYHFAELVVHSVRELIFGGCGFNGVY